MNNKQPNIDVTSSFINNTYDTLSYFDLYGNSVFLFMFMTLFVFLVYSYCQIMQTKESISEDWTNQRCKPQNIAFAGLITHPENTTAFQYTKDNFQFCVQNILTGVAEHALRPLYFMVNSLTDVFVKMSQSIQQTREVSASLRNNVKTFAQDILSRILNITIPMQKIFISLMDVFQKIQGIMTSGLYTMLGSYYTLQALMGAILELIIKMLVTLAIIIVGLWVMPFTWPAAASMSAVFVSISIPLAIIIYFMTEVLHIKSASVPKLRCFDEDTLIHKKDGQQIRIKDIQVGDTLFNGSYVTAKMKITSENMKMYNLHDVIVSQSHLVKYKDKWIRTMNHPDSIEINYNKPFLYCLNTSDKTIKINDILFSDWDEIVNITRFELTEQIHEYLDDGYEETAVVTLCGSQKKITQVEIGDFLENGAFVYGIVEVESRKLRKYKNNQNPPLKLFHLLTTDGTLKINSIDSKDYNNLIDKFII